MQQKIISYNFFILIIGLFICLLVPQSAHSKTELSEMEIKEKRQFEVFERTSRMSLKQLEKSAFFHLKTGQKNNGIGMFEYFHEVIERGIDKKKNCVNASELFRSNFFDQATDKELFSANVNVLSYLVLCNFRLGEFDEGVKLDLEIELYLHKHASKINDDKAFMEYMELVEFFERLEPRLKGIVKQYVLRRQLDYLVWSYTRALNWGNDKVILDVIVKGLEVSLRAKRLDKAQLYLIELDKFNKKQGKGEYDNMLVYFKQKISEMEKSQKPKKKKAELAD